jgi:hypothetical protein
VVKEKEPQKAPETTEYLGNGPAQDTGGGEMFTIGDMVGDLFEKK